MPSVRNATRVTINDVASAAGVSRQTVSNVLNRPDRVASRTRETVEHHVKQLGFRPSRAASLLRRESAGAWGFELDTLGAKRMGNVLDRFLIELTDSASAGGAHILPFVSTPARDMETYNELLVGQHVDGFILANTGFADPRPSWLATEGVPFVAFGRLWDSPEMPNFVDVDGAAGIRMAVRHLREQGYGRIGYLGWPDGSPVGEDRRQGWLDEGGDGPEAHSRQEIDAATSAAAQIVPLIGRGGAIVCASDVLAVGVWRHLTEIGWRIGPDFGIVGFDDTDIAQALGLTSLAQPLEAVAENVLALLAGIAPAQRLLEPELVVRASSTPNSLPSPSVGEQVHEGPAGLD